MSTTPNPIVPYGVNQPSVTPPQGSFTQGDQPAIDPGGSPDVMKQILARILQQSQKQQQQLPAPVPSPIPGGGGAVPQGGIQKGSGARFAAGAISNIIQSGIQQHKAKQLAEAESDWNQLANAMQSGNSQAIQFIMSDPKKLKNMAKALNQDWLNPEKTTVYKQALDNVMKQQEQKGQAAQGLKAMFQKLIHKANNPKLTDQQKQDIAKEIMGRAPTATPGIDKEQQALAAELLKEQQQDKVQAAKDAEAQRKQEETERYNTYRDETKQRFQGWSDQNKQQFTERMDRLRETAKNQRESQHEAAMLKALGIRLSAEDRKKLEITPAQINSEVNGTLTTLRQQLTQASSQLKTMQTAAQNRSGSLWKRIISDSPDVAGAQSQVDNLKAAVDLIEKNRGAIISGKVSLDDIVDQAQTISSGTPPGFK